MAAIIDYGEFAFGSKDEVLDRARRYWNPGKTQFWIDSGVPLVIDRREGYFLYDMSGSIPALAMPHISPVRMRPVCTSSAM